MSRSEALRRLLTFAALSLLASGAVAQSYGDGDQVLTLGAGGFQSVTTTELHVDTDGYINDPGQLLYARVPLLLPDGALIERICLYSRSSIPEVFASATLMEQVLVPSGMGPPVTFTRDGLLSSAGNGYDYSCSDPLSVTVQTTSPARLPKPR